MIVPYYLRVLLGTYGQACTLALIPVSCCLIE